MIRAFLLDNVKKPLHKDLLADPTILKLSGGYSAGIRHGMPIEEFAVGDKTIFQISLDNQAKNPVANPESIQLRDTHPMHAWLLIDVAVRT